MILTPLSIYTLQVSIVDHRDCNTKWVRDIDDSIVCVTGFDEGGSPCQGDSGGPMVTISPSGELLQVAVVHAGDIRCGPGARPTLLSVITEESLEWINRIMDNSE